MSLLLFVPRSCSVGFYAGALGLKKARRIGYAPMRLVSWVKLFFR